MRPPWGGGICWCWADLLQDRQWLALGVQCLAALPGKRVPSQFRIERPGLVVLGDRRKAHDLPVLLRRLAENTGTGMNMACPMGPQ
jgi:hypothetical protein